MTVLRLRLLLIGVFCWVGLMLAIGRSDQLPVVGNINPAFYVYLIAGVAMGGLIAYPERARKPIQVTLIPVLVIYGIFKAVQSTGQTIDASFNYLLVAELIIICGTVYIARLSSIMTAQAEQSIRDSLLQLNTLTVLSEQEGEKVISEEILRARRYERPLTLVRIQIPRLHKKLFTRWSQKNSLEYEYVYLRVVQIIRNLIYDSDIIAWHKDNLVVCLPETNQEEASVLVYPLEAMLTACLHEPAKVGMAHFPGDALVYKDLLEAALTASHLGAEQLPVTKSVETVDALAYDITSYAVEDKVAVRLAEQQSA